MEVEIGSTKVTADKCHRPHRSGNLCMDLRFDFHFDFRFLKIKFQLPCYLPEGMCARFFLISTPPL